jgi:hypothetical protein
MVFLSIFKESLSERPSPHSRHLLAHDGATLIQGVFEAFQVVVGVFWINFETSFVLINIESGSSTGLERYFTRDARLGMFPGTRH